MTLFIEGLGEITASEYVLNDIAILADEAEENLKNRNRKIKASRARDISKAIYEALCEQGFYDNIKI